jgi:hypothetical protein
MYKIFVKDFDCDGCSFLDIMSNVSLFCNSIDDKIQIHSMSIPSYAKEYNLTFPNVVYIGDLDAFYTTDFFKIFPDLVKVGTLLPSFHQLNLGNIKEIDFCRNLKDINSRRDLYVPKFRDIGDGFFMFISNEATSVVKINDYT